MNTQLGPFTAWVPHIVRAQYPATSAKLSGTVEEILPKRLPSDCVGNSKRKKAVRAGVTLAVAVRVAQPAHFSLPDRDVPNYGKPAPEAAADLARACWVPGSPPLHLIEVHGAQIPNAKSFRLASATALACRLHGLDLLSELSRLMFGLALAFQQGLSIASALDPPP